MDESCAKEDEPRALSVFMRRVLQTILLVALAVIVLLVLRYEAPVVFAGVAGILGGVALHGVSAWISKRTGLPHKAAVVAVVLFTLALGVLGTWAVVTEPALVDQVRHLASDLPTAYGDLLGRLREHGLLGPAAALQPNARTILERLTGLLGGLADAAGGLVIVFFFAVYSAADPRAYVCVLLAIVPPARGTRARVEGVLAAIRANLARWLLGRVVAMVFVGVLTGVVLAALKIPVALGLGILAGLLTFIEYLGALLSAVPVALIALSRGPIYVVWTLALFTVVHIIEGYVLTPLLTRTTVRFPPGYALFLQVLLGSVFGPLGLTFATPLAVIVAIAVKKLYVEAPPPVRRGAAASRRRDEPGPREGSLPST